MRLLISGKVQGVGFRWFTRVSARRLGLSGWVMNHDDGTVEVSASGPVEFLEQLRILLGHGPDGAHVTGVLELQPEVGRLEYPFAMRRQR